MSDVKKRIRLSVTGMTCTSCEEHVTRALTAVGAENVTASFRRNEAIFYLSDSLGVDAAKQAVAEVGYQPGNAEILNDGTETPKTREPQGYDYDLFIIGSGSAAFSAAIQAVSYDAKVGMVERGVIGGTCVNIGCIPSKTMLRASEIHHLAGHHSFHGLHTATEAANLAELVEGKNELVAELRQHKYVDLIKEYGFDLIQGEARFTDEQTVEVSGRRITARNFLIATGTSPAAPNIPGLSDVEYLTSTTALEAREVPKRLAVIGSGYIGLELGQMFHNLGAQVTLMQRSARILKSSDPEISEAVTQALTDQGIRIVTGATFHRIEQAGAITRLHISANGQEEVVEADQLLVAAGRAPNTQALNLAAAKVNVGDRGEIVVNEFLRTSNPRIFAAGDVTLGPQFVYVAAHEGSIVADNAMGGAHRRLDLSVVPGVTFTTPSVATVGLTEEAASARGYEVITSVLPLEAVPRALVNRETVGVFKLVSDAKTRKLLGAHIVAENAGEVVYAATLAVKFGLTIEDLRETLAPYLTMAEGLKLAALTFDKDVSKLSCCAG